MQATGSVTWAVGAQASVLGRCSGGGGVPYPSSASSSAPSGRFQGNGAVRCCAQAQAQERKPRVRKTKEERREMVESFVNTYRVSNNGKFPSVNLTHKEVGGSYYIVREIVRDIIQENRVLGPGGLNAKTLSFEDCPDPSEVSLSHELGQDSIEVLDMSDKEEAFPLQNNFISTQQLLGSSNLLEPVILNSIVQNGNVGDAPCLEENLEKQEEALYEKSRESEDESSEIQAPSLSYVSVSHKEIELDTVGNAHEGVASSINDEVSLLSGPSAFSQTNGALPHKYDCDDISNSAVDEANLCSDDNGVLQTSQIIIEEHEILSETASIMTGDVQITDGQFISATSANQMDAYTSHTSAETVDSVVFIERQDVDEQPLLDAIASPDEQVKSGNLASQPGLDAKGLLQKEDQHNTLEKDESEPKKSISGITNEEPEAITANHEHGISTTTTIGRRTGKGQNKKEDNLFWLIIRAFVVSMSKLWAN